MKRCIFYLPYKLDEKAMGARMMRPRKMKKAFEDIGYEVFSITGVSEERRKLIRQVKKEIRNGVKYDFIYMEAHTEPTLLTDPSHLPTHPFLDFGFLRFLKKNNIRIGLFYPDIYWKFDSYGVGLPMWKKKGALWCYQYEMSQYKKLMNKFYLPNYRVAKYLEKEGLTDIIDELPPGSENLQVKEEHKYTGDPIKLFYVGGIGGHYQIGKLIQAVNSNKKYLLTICCRKAEWEKEKEKLQIGSGDQIRIVHLSGDELEKEYAEADICCMIFERDYYVDMAIPYKAFEYLGNEKPVIATSNTAIGDFVEENNVGWCVNNDAGEIGILLNKIASHPELFFAAKKQCRRAKSENLWTVRAQKVADDLSR